MQVLRWDVFCRVVDNFGDIGVCWRLAADLASRGQRVRLFVDDAAALQWMAPDGAAGVEVREWSEADRTRVPGDVVIEAFGCDLPRAFLRRMAEALRPPRWFNLEYLSAEDFVERSHRLASPPTEAPAAGLRKSFYYPGFTARTGGLLREPDLLSRIERFDAAAWLEAHGARTSADERVVSLFCYDQPALRSLVDQLSTRPTLLLATAGTATRQVTDLLGPELHRGHLRVLPLEPLSQHDYDGMLWACDLNFVRGEDSFVRAQWAGRPFVWQIYPQDDGAHRVKLDAFLTRFGASSELRAFHHGWSEGRLDLPPLPEMPTWQAQCERWREGLLAQVDLTTQLLGAALEAR